MGFGRSEVVMKFTQKYPTDRCPSGHVHALIHDDAGPSVAALDVLDVALDPQPLKSAEGNP